jgi:hypothetical protein
MTASKRWTEYRGLVLSSAVVREKRKMMYVGVTRRGT